MPAFRMRIMDLSRLCAVTLATTLPSCSAGAEPPLNIQQLLVAGQRWQLLSAFDYRSAPGPAGVLERGSEITAALRYGVTGRLELNARLQGGELIQRRPGAETTLRYRGIAAGVNWLLKPETATPALLLESSVRLHDSAGDLQRNFSAGDIALTAYSSIDPVVLSLTAALALRRGYRQEGRSVSAAYGWSLAPQVNFAVNHRVTLIGGLLFAYRQAQRVDGVPSGRGAETLSLRAGLGYGLTPQSTLFLHGDFAAGGIGNSASLRWFHTF